MVITLVITLTSGMSLNSINLLNVSCRFELGGLAQEKSRSARAEAALKAASSENAGLKDAAARAAVESTQLRPALSETPRALSEAQACTRARAPRAVRAALPPPERCARLGLRRGGAGGGG